MTPSTSSHKRIRPLPGLLTIALITLLSAAVSPAADFTLAWTPNCGDCQNLIGYNLYYKANDSVVDDPYGAHLIYIPLDEPGFDPENPTYQLTGLQDDVTYFFALTAMYGDEESQMSNEAAVTNGRAMNDAPSSGGSSSSAGCFIGILPHWPSF